MSKPVSADHAPDIRLGLIGDNITRSQAPFFHRMAGRMTGLNVSYDRLIPKAMGMEFDAVFDHCTQLGLRGINVTYPYKETVTGKVRIDDPLVKAMGAVNTVVFDQDGPVGHNTDYSGFIAAYRGVLGDTAPGPVCMIGAGGVGKAVAFGLLALGARDFRLVEKDLRKAEGLAAALLESKPGIAVIVTDDPASASREAAGLVNSTPVGMVGYDGTPLPRRLMHSAEWAFDAVYTPVETQFLKDAEAEGVKIISGYELFFYQAVHAWNFFCGRPLDERKMRIVLDEASEVDVLL